MSSLQGQKRSGYEQEEESTLRGAALGSRDAEIHDGHVHKTEYSLGSIGAGQIKTSYDVEEPSPVEGRSPVLHSVKERRGEEDRDISAGPKSTDPVEEVTRETGDLKLSYTTEDDPQPHRSTLQKIKDKITDKDKVKLGTEKKGHEAKPGLLTRLKQKVWSSEGGSPRKHSDRRPDPEEIAVESEASSGSDPSFSTDSSGSERIFTSGGHREEAIKEPTLDVREQMATAGTPTSLAEGALPSSELGTGYEEDSDAPLKRNTQQLEDPTGFVHTNPKWSAYKESGPPGEAATGDAPPALSTPVAQDRLPSSKEDIPPLEEVKAPGVLDRVKEEVAAVGDTVQETLGLKSDNKGTLIQDSTSDEETGVLGRFARRIGLVGSDASHGRSQSS